MAFGNLRMVNIMANKHNGGLYSYKPTVSDGGSFRE